MVKIQRRLGAIACAAVGLVVLVAGCGISRLEPGYAAVKIHYDQGGAREDIPTGGYLTYNPVTERIAEYPVGQQSLVMVRREGEGKVKGDDSVEVRAQGIPVNFDTTVFFRVDPQHIADLFQLRPGVPLIGKDINDGLDGIVVRRLTRGVMQDVGALYTWIDLYGAKRNEFSQKIFEALAPQLASEYIILDRFQLGEIYLQQAQQDSLNAIATANQNVLTQTQNVEAEKQKALASTYSAQAQAAPIIANADAESQAIAKREAALAAAPHVIDYDTRIHQADHPVQTLITNGNGQPTQPAVVVGGGR